MSAEYDIPTLYKQPAESRLYSFDFTANLEDVEVITGVVGFTVTPVDLTIGTPSFAGKLVQCQLGGGTSGTEYKIDITIVTDTPNTLEGVANLFVRKT